ncbi:MAG: alpha-1,2-fucosyltransferase [Proteobacteria bacterium]|nr:alpha-1,2-fucosyltransferase [Pseudomonadota bacterium]
MVISQLLGGLGNQMFQYAAGRALSMTLGCPLLLDLSGFKDYSLHNGFEIDRVMRLSVCIAKPDQLRELLGWRSGNLTRKLLRRLPFRRVCGRHLVVEPHFNYWTGFNKIIDSSYLVGYWQSEKYFKDFELSIRSDFEFKKALTGENLKISSLMKDYNSVSLHVRRGDYVTHAATAKILNLCSLDYYQEAIDHIAAKVTSPRFFVFSDDPQWTRNNLKIAFPTQYIDRNFGSQNYIDMQLMGQCKHHIIANSSFSWWGAWLNTNPNKLVVAPRNWFGNGINDSDLIPREWVRL